MAAVPNTSTFTLQDVCMAVFGDATSGRSLSSCFSYANSTLFDSSYSGSKNNLLNFRNYGYVKTNNKITPHYVQTASTQFYVYVTSQYTTTTTLSSIQLRVVFSNGTYSYYNTSMDYNSTTSVAVFETTTVGVNPISISVSSSIIPSSDSNYNYTF